MVPLLGSQALKALTPQPAVTVDRSRCVRHRCSRNGCRQCLDVCPSGAITWGTQGLRVDLESCEQCLRCLSVCPTAALHSPEISLPQILSDLAAHRLPVLGCHRQPASEAHARMPCLGYLAHGELMIMLALTYAGGLQIHLTACRDCPNGHIVAAVRDAHARMSELKPDHHVRLVLDRNELQYKPTALSRRELFVSFRRHTTRSAVVMARRLQADPGVQPYGNKRVPVTRVLLRKAVEELPETRRQGIADRIFGQISFTPACDACGGCVGICPSGAIRPTEEGKPYPRFDSGLCVTCGSCEAFCLKQGVMVAEGGSSRPLTGHHHYAGLDERWVG